MRQRKPAPLRRVFLIALILALPHCVTGAVRADVLLPKEVQFPLGLSTWQDLYDRGVAGSCDPLLSAVSVPKSEYDYSHLLVLGEMHDRGVCVPVDPAMAYGYFLEVTETMRWSAYLRVAWKLWHGHGIQQDREAAKERIRAFFFNQSSISEDRLWARAKNQLKELPPPPPLKEALNWLIELRADLVAYADWAADLFLGKARFYDGSLMPRNESAARDILLFDINSRYSKFRYGEVSYLSAKNEDDVRSALFSLSYEFFCNYLPPLLLKIEIYSDKRFPGVYSEVATHEATLLAEHHGGDVAALLNGQRQNFSEDILLEAKRSASKRFKNASCPTAF